MLSATRELIRMFRTGTAFIPAVKAAVRFIQKFGSKEDVRPLLDVFLENPGQFESQLLLDAVKSHGDTEEAERILHACFDGETLKPDMPEEVLYCLGYLGYEPAQPVLLKYMREDDWYLSANACLGLVHLSCRGAEDEIERMIRSCMGQALFHEFVPALAFKTGREELVGRLVEWGSTAASVDCNAGLLLGIALFGEKTREQYKQVLWDERWEAGSSSTGTRWWAYVGMQHLRISFAELYGELREAARKSADPENSAYRLWVLHSLLECRISEDGPTLRFGRVTGESCADIYRALFEWSTPHRDDSVFGWIRENIPDEEDWIRFSSMFSEIRDRMELKIAQEFSEKHAGPVR
jgi:hypothetical protein